jgi:hypothetical protein
MIGWLAVSHGYAAASFGLLVARLGVNVGINDRI